MPLHEFDCKVCSYQFEALVFQNEEISCPQCSSISLNQQWSLPAVPPTMASKMQDACGPGCCKLPGMPSCGN